ncbi:hypothetical protein [Frigidibacter sp. SD6-1]|uniref:hypothetical protein n=1 Tax=Frigidibacter sp. SD6-1 TaxID=3032581 RepID=UPI0024DF31B4|nr:hypothetical protein [Frigidibacter sp. SD6-1]
MHAPHVRPFPCRPKRLLACLALAGLPSHAALAACTLPAFVRSEVPGASAILAAPTTGAAQIGNVPMVDDPDHGRMGGEVTITDIRDGYAAITDVHAWGDPDRTALWLADQRTEAPIWVRGICGAQETTCDGVTGNE